MPVLSCVNQGVPKHHLTDSLNKYEMELEQCVVNLFSYSIQVYLVLMIDTKGTCLYWLSLLFTSSVTTHLRGKVLALYEPAFHCGHVY